MPVIAHIMLALVYITASVVGAVALYVNGIVPSVTAGIIGATTALAMIQLHMAISRAGGGGVTEKDLFEIKQELRKITSRVAQNEQHAAELKSSFERDIAQRRETILNEMRGLEGMIQNLSKKFETRLQSVRAQPSADVPLDGGASASASSNTSASGSIQPHR